MPTRRPLLALRIALMTATSAGIGMASPAWAQETPDGMAARGQEAGPAAVAPGKKSRSPHRPPARAAQPVQPVVQADSPAVRPVADSAASTIPAATQSSGIRLTRYGRQVRLYGVY